tara:strand:+ start:363 stop:1073 length:711 start_codon:yes stop_codon:yes gene_type:complete
VKNILTCILLVLNFSLLAQITISEPSNSNKSFSSQSSRVLSDNTNIGVRFGINFISLHHDENSYLNETNEDKMIYPGFGLSVLSTQKISSRLKFIVELGLVQKKDKRLNNLSHYGINSNFDYIYYRKVNQAFISMGFLVSPISNFSINLSPYVAYSTKINTKQDRIARSTNYESYYDDLYEIESSAFEYGLNLNLAYLIKDHYLFSVGYSRGRLDSNSQIDPINRGFTLGVAYMLN